MDLIDYKSIRHIGLFYLRNRGANFIHTILKYIFKSVLYFIYQFLYYIGQCWRYNISLILYVLEQNKSVYESFNFN